MQTLEHVSLHKGCHKVSHLNDSFYNLTEVIFCSNVQITLDCFSAIQYPLQSSCFLTSFSIGAGRAKSEICRPSCAITLAISLAAIVCKEATISLLYICEFLFNSDSAPPDPPSSGSGPWLVFECYNPLDDDPPPGVVLYHSVFGTVSHKHRIKHQNKGYGTVRGPQVPPGACRRFPPQDS